MAGHGNPDADDFTPTVPDGTWTQVTATEGWETTPAADSAANSKWN
jgi:hypothetical protein